MDNDDVSMKEEQIIRRYFQEKRWSFFVFGVSRTPLSWAKTCVTLPMRKWKQTLNANQRRYDV
jgi:hypothetical protein